MYANFFGLRQPPFSIAPDPRYLFMSERHRDALAHLLYGAGGGGGFVLLTGEIGAGKTTVCRCFLEQIPKRCNVAYIFNPKLTVTEMLKSVCDEFRIPCRHPVEGQAASTVKDYLDPINEFLLRTHAVGQNNILIIDEAQHLSADVLEQLRLLTNLETSERKLLQIILIGQPELRQMLARPELEQLAQRVIARFHLEALSEGETSHYIRHRLAVAGVTTARPFGRRVRRRIHQLARGVPRRINLLCDRALLGAYAAGKSVVDDAIVEQAAREVFGLAEPPAMRSAWRGRGRRLALAGIGLAAAAVAAAAVAWGWRSAAPASPAAVAGPAASTPAPRQAAAASAGASGTAGGGPVLQSIDLTGTPAQPVWREERPGWLALGAIWGLAATPGDTLCSGWAARHVQCFKGLGTLDLLRQLNRPAVLTLLDAAGRPVYALLSSLEAGAVELRLGGRTQRVSPQALAEHWRGEFATLWRSPAGYRGAFGQGQSGPLVAALARSLSQASGQSEAAAGDSPVFDAELKSRLLAYQVRQGLQPDGVAGPTTFMQLNRSLGVEEPRLPLRD